MVQRDRRVSLRLISPRTHEHSSSFSVRLVGVVVVMGLALTLLSTWAAARTDRETEQRLLRAQTAQAASVLDSAVNAIEEPLRTSLEIAALTVGEDRSAGALRKVLDEAIGSGGLFVTASVWSQSADGFKPLLVRGASPTSGQPAAGTGFLERAASSNTVVVQRVETATGTHIAYAYGRPTGPQGKGADAALVAYAERAIPATRRAPVDGDVAYQRLNYAIYLGTDLDPAQMTTTNVDPASLPLAGEVMALETVPFGDTVLTLTTTPRVHLGSSLSDRLPWLLLAGGLVLTLVAALVTARLSSARRAAESDTATIRSLYEEVDAVYGQQRELFVALQRALLPQADPHIDHLEVAAEYVAGAIGIDIGGDWYSVLRLDGSRFAFVVGDVSGRGVEAVAEMARARFTLRAYLMQGDSPAEALTKSSAQFDVATDGHIVTVLVGFGDAASGHLRLANAGHPPLLLLTDQGADYISVPTGPPLGLGKTTYDEASVTMPPGSTLLAYTDGLVERRGEVIDEGLERLRRTASGRNGQHLSELVKHLLAALGDAKAPDDTAVLALRRS